MAEEEQDGNGRQREKTNARHEGGSDGTDAGGQESAGGSGADAQVLKPEELPRPTFWPAVMALAVTFFLWGFVSAIPITFVGAGLFILALTGWIREMLR